MVNSRGKDIALRPKRRKGPRVKNHQLGGGGFSVSKVNKETQGNVWFVPGSQCELREGPGIMESRKKKKTEVRKDRALGQEKKLRKVSEQG